MEKFYGEICQFLHSHGLYIYKVRVGYGYISAKTQLDTGSCPILLMGIVAESQNEAKKQQSGIRSELERLNSEFGTYPLIITEDRWMRQTDATRARILAHLKIFTQIYARNCDVRRIDKATAQSFLEANHSYGDAACKYRYGLYLKRHTGHNAQSKSSPAPGTLVAVATFSNARKWTKGDKTIRSYEWTRYASLSGVRLSGGMGKVLNTFIQEIQPDDIMTYADLEWSEGKVYEQLGFMLEGVKEEVTFAVDENYRRSPHRLSLLPMTSHRYLMNFGSNKYRLKLTDYP